MSAEIEQYQNRISDAMRALEYQSKIAKGQRYAGLFTGADKKTGAMKMTYTIATGSQEQRDSLSKLLLEGKYKNDLDNLHIETSNTVGGNSRWPYDLSVSAMGDGITNNTQSYEAMATYLEQVVRTHPQIKKQMSWQEFKKGYDVSDNMRWKSGAAKQVQIFDTLSKLVAGMDMFVVGNHKSKSIDLPVVQLHCPSNGTKITIRDNFHDLCISVDAPFPIQDIHNMTALFNPDDCEGFFEGFKPSDIHVPYGKNSQQFSCTIRDYPALMMLVSDITRQDDRAELNPHAVQKAKINRSNAKKP